MKTRKKQSYANSVNSVPFLPRDAYAYRGLCRRKMFVRLSVCHTPVFCQHR